MLLSCPAQVAEIEDSEDFSVVSTSSDERIWIVTFTKSDLPSTSYMYNRSACCRLLVVCRCSVGWEAAISQHAGMTAQPGPLRIMFHSAGAFAGSSSAWVLAAALLPTLSPRHLSCLALAATSDLADCCFLTGCASLGAQPTALLSS